MASSPSLQTYHCICSNLVLATTFPLDHYRKLDRAIILPRPSTSARVASAAGLASDTGSGGENDEDWPPTNVTLLTSTIDQDPLRIRSDDGIETRYPFKCDRCKVTLGYQLDGDQYEKRDRKQGRRDDVLYLLEGAVIKTEAMKTGGT